MKSLLKAYFDWSTFTFLPFLRFVLSVLFLCLWGGEVGAHGGVVLNITVSQQEGPWFDEGLFLPLTDDHWVSLQNPDPDQSAS